MTHQNVPDATGKPITHKLMADSKLETSVHEVGTLITRSYNPQIHSVPYRIY